MSLIIQDMAGLLVSTAILHLAGVWLVKVLKEKKEIFAKIAGLSSVAYGVMLVGQIFMTLITGVSV
jgi:hydrogenase/urease accessory protein HupE